MADRSQLEPLLTPGRLQRLRTVLENRVAGVTVVLENLHKDYNMNAILRTCESFGIQDVHVVPQPGEGKVFRTVTQGCHRWLSIHRYENVLSCFHLLRRDGFRIAAGSLGEHSVPLEQLDWSGRIALVFSNELDGAGEEVLDQVDSSFVIPMEGFSQSLNVSVAAGIAIHHVLGLKQKAEDLERIPRKRAETLLIQWIGKSVKNADVVLEELEKRG
jgi:tRNA (guanosine-2'-O-)-methyltransferase